MKAILTLDNGKKIVADILPPPIGKLRRARFHGKYRPLHLYCFDEKMRRWKLQHAIEAFDAFIPDDRIKIAVRSRGCATIT